MSHNVKSDAPPLSLNFGCGGAPSGIWLHPSFYFRRDSQLRRRLGQGSERASTGDASRTGRVDENHWQSWSWKQKEGEVLVFLSLHSLLSVLLSFEPTFRMSVFFLFVAAVFPFLVLGKKCVDALVPVSINARQGLFNVPEITDNVVATRFALNLTDIGRNFTDDALIGYHNVEGKYHISARLCHPDSGIANDATIQVLTHGIVRERCQRVSRVSC
jgi:hypothetical protein